MIPSRGVGVLLPVLDSVRALSDQTVLQSLYVGLPQALAFHQLRLLGDRGDSYLCLYGYPSLTVVVASLLQTLA